MQTITLPAGTRDLVPGSDTAMNSLANGTYASIGVINMSSIDPFNVALELEVTPGAVSGDKGIYIFGRASFNGGTVFSTGPVSGTNTADERNLTPIGFLPCNTNSVLQRDCFSIAAAYDLIPPHVEIIVKNATGAALPGSGHAAYVTPYTVISG